MKTKNIYKMKEKLFIIFSLVFLLQGCVFVAGAAAGAAGIAVVYDHRKIERILEDQKITQKISDQLADIPDLRDHARVDVTCFNHVVLLTGQTQTPLLRQQIEDVARSVSGVEKVYNQITVGSIASPLTHANDTWITTKIKTEMLATDNLRSSLIKVVTENGSVYLMGVVSKDQADISVNIARKVSGVRRVVKIFQYTN